jgi:hypothetical protein
MASLKDRFSQKVYLHVVETAANAGGIDQVVSQVNASEQVGMLIHRVQYSIPYNTRAAIIAAADSVHFGLCMWKIPTLTALLDENTVGVIHKDYLHFGPAGLTEPTWRLSDHDFSGYPGGGLVAHPSSLWVAICAISIAVAAEVKCTIHYTTFKLTDKDYQELYNMQILNSIVAG